MSNLVRITDVSPRDGLQNESGVIATVDKVRLIDLLCAAGVDEIEITSFVSPKWVPQLADSADVVRAVLGTSPESGVKVRPALSVLVPNEKGRASLYALELEIRDAHLRRAVKHGINATDHARFMNWLDKPLIDTISVFTAASETFSQRNTNATIDQTIDRFKDLIAQDASVHTVRGYVSCAIACPFEGPIAPRRVARVVEQLIEIGIREIDLGDTIGAADVASVTHLLLTIRDVVPPSWFESHRVTLHLHDTFGRAADCVTAALGLGVVSFDGSVAGLGGCPYASTPSRRAPGNIDTGLLVSTIHKAGFRTNVDLDRLEVAAEFARTTVAKSRASQPGAAS